MPNGDHDAAVPPRPRNPVSTIGRWLGAREWAMRCAPVIVWLERVLRGATNNRLSLVGIAGLPSVQVTVPGRKTGLPRTTALLGVPYGDGVVVTGSNWGKTRHPVWSANLLAADTALVKLGAHEQTMRVRTVDGDERDRLWRAIVEYWPGYAMEERLSGGRRFRMFSLEPLIPAAEDPDRGGMGDIRTA